MSNYREPTAQDDVSNKIGLNTDISIVGFNGDNPIRAKIDTGAQFCSLHADNLNVVTNEITKSSVVKFTYNNYQYSMNVNGFQSVTSADGGTNNRPSIVMGVRINEIFIPDVVFNLNDRSNMDYPVLIGMNLIEAGKFVIDPTITEMEVSFGPDGYKVIDGDTPSDITPVDKVGEIKDNSSNDSLSEFLKSLKDRPFAEAICEISKKLQQFQEECNDTTNPQ